MKSVIVVLFIFAQSVTLWAQSSAPTYDFKGNQEAIPFKLIDNRIFLPILINGKEGHLVLDTGGIWGLNEDFALRLGLKADSRFTIQGDGAERVEAWRTNVDNVKLGKIVIFGNFLSCH